MNIRDLIAASFLGLAVNLTAAETISIVTTPVPHVEILEQVRPELEKQGYKLEIREFTDCVLPNLAIDSGEVDANFFQHTPYLEEFNKNRGTKLIKIADVHIEPMAVCSKKYKSLDDTKEGTIIAILNGPTSESRALDIITKRDLVGFKEKAPKTPLDITANLKKIESVGLKAAQLLRTLNDADFAVINSNYALSADLNPAQDGVFIEDKESPYANILVIKTGNENDPKIQVLAKTLQSEKVKRLIIGKYKSSVLPAF